MLTGNVLVTGGAGFLARGLYRRALQEEWPVNWTCFSRDDSKHVALQKKFPNVRCIRGDVAGDRSYLAAAMMGHETVIHMAAVKYVDLAETNVFDTVRVNVYGSENVAWAAISAGVQRVVGISTDKACQPVNLYGMTKAVMERQFVEANRLDAGTIFTLCRYGNVIGSTGSVIPLFRTQLARDGVVKVTDPDMTRFWMSVDEAVDVIVTAAYETGGTTIIPLPRAATIMTVVHAAVGAAQVEIVGARPGEKQHEDLMHEQESVRAVFQRVDGGYGYWVIYPPGEVKTPLAIRLSSAAPDQWMLAAEMVALIEDAETV